MPNKSADAGRRFENRTRDALTHAGYHITKTPGSKSPLDMVALDTDPVRRAAAGHLMVQCKVDGRLGPAGWNALYDLAHSVGFTPILAERNNPRNTLRYWRLDARKSGLRGQRQPMTELTFTVSDGVTFLAAG